jgi:hypothetical protein
LPVILTCLHGHRKRAALHRSSEIRLIQWDTNTEVQYPSTNLETVVNVPHNHKKVGLPNKSARSPRVERQQRCIVCPKPSKGQADKHKVVLVPHNTSVTCHRRQACTSGFRCKSCGVTLMMRTHDYCCWIRPAGCGADTLRAHTPARLSWGLSFTVPRTKSHRDIKEFRLKRGDTCPAPPLPTPAILATLARKHEAFCGNTQDQTGHAIFV